MVLVDTSVWIDHLRSKDDQLVKLLESNQVYMHPMVMGELACGNLQNRQLFLSLLKNLPCASEATHDEVLHHIEKNGLMSKGVGFIDLHLLASTLLTPHTSLWTRDSRLQKISQNLNVNWEALH